MNVPEDLKYSEEHEWVRVKDSVATIGITDYAQGELGDLVFIELPSLGDEAEQSESLGTIEAVKAVSDLFSPVSGKVLEVNENLADDPETVNRDPYGDGWIVKIELSDPSELDDLLDATAYKEKIS